MVIFILKLGKKAVKMKTVFGVLAFTLAVVAAVPNNPQRIVGGSATTISQYPSIAALLYTRDWSSYLQECGGSILNFRSILTAANCLVGDVSARWRVRVGSSWAHSGGVVHNSQEFIIHPDFNRWTMDNDIAILRTATIITFISDSVQPASIAGSTYIVPDNEIVWAAGWGHTTYGGETAEQLQHVQVWIVNHDACRTRYSTLGSAVTDNMICSGWLDVGGRDQCQGDAGGPLYHVNVLGTAAVVGICSWGEQCGLRDFPGVNTRVSAYTSWIQANA